MTAEHQADTENLSSKQHHERAVDTMKTGNMQAARQHLEHGLTLIQQELAANPTDELRQRASEMFVQQGRYWDRMARNAQTDEDVRRFRADAMGSVQAGLEIARQSTDKTLLVLPLVFLGDLQVRADDPNAAITTYREALTYPLPPGHTPAYRYVIEGKTHKTEYAAGEKTQTGSNPLDAAERALEDLQTFSGTPTPDVITRDIWVIGGQLDIAEVIAQKHDVRNRDKAYQYFGSAMKALAEDAKGENNLIHRREDAKKVKEVLEDDLEAEFADAQALRNNGEQEKLDEALTAYTTVQTHAAILDDRIMEGHAVHMRGVTRYQQEQLEEAEEEYVAAQKIFEGEKNTMLEAAVLRDRSSIARKQKDFEKAHKLIRQSIDLLQGTGNPEHLGMSYLKEAQVYAAENKPQEAQARIEEGIQTVDQGGDTYFKSHARMNAAELLIQGGIFDQAKTLLDEAEEVLAQVERNQSTRIIFQADRDKITRLRKQVEDKN